MKHPVKVSTFNARTLKSMFQMSELAASVINFDINILCVQEHCLFHEDHDLEHHELDKNWTFVSVSPWINFINSTIGGVGLLLSPHALNSVEKITSRIMVANFNGNPSTTVTWCYSSINVNDEEGVINVYNDRLLYDLYQNTTSSLLADI
ncbi:uncharacterized protein LOC115214377 [Octopus sinensis]|uniref:Uncharacterized protein LOC115214377 n=1 Tax=Octopus sinensis TaxID=2607531 RepID=A0A6P7SLY4_9MOLL|nr:uncharacterized protein LOC115214377 [Octopus sinensis]